jgi:hypothetical protein
MVLNPPTDTTIYCGEVPEMPIIKGVDNFSDVTIEVEEVIVGDINHSYDIIRKWTLRDDCGNEASAEQIISMINYDMTCEIIQLDDIYCASHGNEICTEVSGGVAPYTYQWSIASGICVIEGGVNEDCIETYVGFETIELSVIVTDANGCKTSCSYFIDCIDDLAAKEKAEQESLSDELIFEVYPNPVFHTLTISYLIEHESIVEIQFFNSVGKLVTSDVMSGLAGLNTEEINVSELNPGLYYLHLKNEGKTGMKKVIRIE